MPTVVEVWPDHSYDPSQSVAEIQVLQPSPAVSQSAPKQEVRIGSRTGTQTQVL